MDVSNFIKRFAMVCLENPTFGEIPYEFLGAVGDPEVGPIMAALAYQFAIDGRFDAREVDALTDEEVMEIAHRFVRSFYLESVRRAFAKDRPKTFALRDARLSEFMAIDEISFDDEEAVHSMRLKIQNALGIEIGVEDMRRIMNDVVDDLAKMDADRGTGETL